MKKAYDFQYKDTTITMFADTKKEATAIFADEYKMSVKQAGKLFIPAIKPVEEPKQEEPKQEEPKQEEPKQEEPKQDTTQKQLVTIDGDAMTVTFFIRSQQKDEKEEIHGTVTPATRKLSIPKAYTGTGAEIEQFIIADTIAAIDNDKNRANRILAKEDATEEAKEEAKEAIRIFEEQSKLVQEIREKAGYPAEVPSVAEYPLSRILACVVTRVSLPVEYGTAKKALKEVCNVYRVILYENRALTDKEQETVTAVKTALYDILKPFSTGSKDSKGFNLRIKNTDIVDLFLCSWKMEEDGKLTCTAGSKRGTLEKNLFKVAFGKVLHLEEETK